MVSAMNEMKSSIKSVCITGKDETTQKYSSSEVQSYPLLEDQFPSESLLGSLPTYIILILLSWQIKQRSSLLLDFAALFSNALVLPSCDSPYHSSNAYRHDDGGA
jgi:hypothetical protein